MRSNTQGLLSGMGKRDTYVGQEAIDKGNLVHLTRPMEWGTITDAEGMEDVWYHTFYNGKISHWHTTHLLAELRTNPIEHPVLLTEALLNPVKNREKMVEIMFETFNIPATFVIAQPILAVYSSGRCSAMSVDVGDGICQMMPIFEGYTLPASLTRTDIAGGFLTDHCMQTLKKLGHSFTTASDREVARQIKEKLCYCSLNYESEMNNSPPSRAHFELPNGDTVTFGKERISIPEILFNPSLIGIEEKGIHHTLYDALQRCDIDTKKDLYGNVVLAGATTCMEKFSDRFQKEYLSLLPGPIRGRVVVSNERANANWIGGSIIASLSTFQLMWITAEEYIEVGFIGAKDYVQFPSPD